jgi:CheY-like chemotaxis protein
LRKKVWTLAHEKILVVEDNPVHRELLTDLLQARGYQVREASSGPEAQSLVKSTLPDLVVMDVQLPGADGLTVAQAMREDAETKGIPVVVLTAYANKNNEAKAEQAGCRAFMTKPLDTRAFVQLIASILSEHRGGHDG